MSIPVIAIFDIGKTNKKLFLFDEDYQICFEKTEQLPEVKDEDGFPCEDIEGLTKWVISSFTEVLAWPEFHINALNVSAHGASFVHIDKEGKPVAPLYNYLKPYPEKLKNKFYQLYGGESEFAKNAASPVLGNLNSGMQLYWLKESRSEVFNKIKYSLHLPEFISYLFTNIPASGITSIGCHTNLWDFTQNNYHSWVKLEHIIEKLPPLCASSKANRITFGEHTFNIGIGLHDSSAALIPYLATFNEPFILISTGTWSISLNPFNHSPLTDDELRNDCLCYLTYEGKPVKASRLFAGYEHEQETKRIAEHFHVAADNYKNVQYQPNLIKQLALTNYPLPNYASYDEAYTHLILHLVKRQATSTNLVLKNTSVKRIFVDGGFSHNEIYMNLLAQAFPEYQVCAAFTAQASAVGAALAIHPYWNSKPIPSALIQLIEYPKD